MLVAPSVRAHPEHEPTDVSLEPSGADPDEIAPVLRDEAHLELVWGVPQRTGQHRITEECHATSVGDQVGLSLR
jgi:hypothetical protein